MLKYKWAGLFWSCALAFAGGPGAFAESKLPAVSAPAEIGRHISQCWKAPRTDPPQVIEVTVRLSFSRTGAVIGEPRVVYIGAAAEAKLRGEIAASILAAIKACTPLPFTPSLGAAIAGRMFAIRFRSLPLSGRQRLT
jgi:hypothetical protein